MTDRTRFAWKAAKHSFWYVTGGMSIPIILTCVTATATEITWKYWTAQAGLYLMILAIIFVIPYFVWKPGRKAGE